MDRIFINGTILTMDDTDSTAEALAVAGGRIEAVGSTDQIRSMAGNQTVVTDLQGKTLLPGFIEAHGHFPWSGFNAVGANLNSPPIGSMACVADIFEALNRKASETPRGKWVVGFGYDDTSLAEKRYVTRDELDEVFKEHPVYISHISGHVGMANSLALEAAGIDAHTPDPEGGVICRDPDTGQPTGVLEEKAAHEVFRLAADFSMEENLAILKWAVDDYARHGVTTVQCGYADEKLFNGLSLGVQAGQIPLRLIVWPEIELAEKIIAQQFEAAGPDPDFFQVGAAKIIGDGSIQAYTAYLSRPYHSPFKGDRRYRGYPVTERRVMVELVKKFHRAGLQIAIHGNGDACIDDIIYAIEQAQQEYPRQDHRHIIVHCQTVRDDQLDAMKRLGITASFFPAHTYYWGDRHASLFLGPDRAGRINPTRTALEKKIRFTIHLDTPITPIDPLLLVWSAVNRLSTGGRVIGADECISPVQALRATTIDAAWQVFQEKNRGSLEAGKYADLAVLSGNPLNRPDSIRDIRVLETVVGGKTVYK